MLFLGLNDVTAGGQQGKGDIAPVLDDLFSRMLSARQDAERVRLNDSVRLIIDSYVVSDSVMKHEFGRLRYLGQILSPDKRLKIINWNLILHDGTNRYYLYMIRKDGPREGCKVYKLTGEHRERPVSTDMYYSAGNWYGALYYAIQPFRSGKQVCYILLGIDTGKSMISRKIIDVISFTPGGEIIFGRECFLKDGIIKTREVLEYYSGGMITLKMYSRKKIVFDHVVTIEGDDQKDNPRSYGAEYTYDSYIYRKGSWYFTKNVDVINSKKNKK
jgi:hypothetical protein